jgi:hypothetical protein
MATDVRTKPEPSVTSLVTGILSDTQDLFKQQFELLKQEVRDDFRKTKEGGLTVAIAGGLGLVGGILLVQMLVYLTQWLLPDWPLWVCFGIWGVLMFGTAVGLFFIGKSTLDTIDPVPEKSAQALKENVQWLTNQK